MNYFSAPGIIKKRKQTITLNEITQIICDDFGVTTDYVITKSKQGNRSYIRFIIMYFAVDILKIPYTELKHHFLMKNHTSIVNGMKTIRGYMDFDNEVRERMKTIKDKLINSMIGVPV